MRSNANVGLDFGEGIDVGDTATGEFINFGFFFWLNFPLIPNTGA